MCEKSRSDGFDTTPGWTVEETGGAECGGLPSVVGAGPGRCEVLGGLAGLDVVGAELESEPAAVVL